MLIYVVESSTDRNQLLYRQTRNKFNVEYSEKYWQLKKKILLKKGLAILALAKESIGCYSSIR